MPLDPKIYGAGLKQAKIKLAAGTIIAIEAVVEVTGDPQQEAVDIKGDDVLKTSFVFSQSEDVVIRANAITFDALQAITGNSISSSAVGEEIPLGTDSQQNPPFVELQTFVRAKRADGTNTTIQKVFHKVQITNVHVINSNGSEFSVELTGKAFKTDKLIGGSTLTPARIATLKEATNL